MTKRSKTIDLQSYYDKLLRSYAFFVREVYYYVDYLPMHPFTWVERDMLDWVQHCPYRNVGVAAPRGFGKTSLITVTYPLWRILRDRNDRVIVLSATKPLAIGMVSTMRQMMERCPFMRHLEPRSASLYDDQGTRKGRQDSAQAFRVVGITAHHSPSVRAFSLDSTVTGSRANAIMNDDLEVERNCETSAKRDKIAVKIDEAKNLMFPSGLGGSVNPRRNVFCLTYHPASDSVYERMAAIPEPKSRLHIRTWPIQAPEPDHVHIGLSPKISEGLATGRFTPGELLMPHRYSDDDVENFKSTGGHTWERQYQLRVGVAEYHQRPLRIDNLIISECPVEYVRYPVVWGEVDQSGRSTAITDIQSLCPEGRPLRRPSRVGYGKHRYERIIAYVDPSGDGRDSTGLTVIGVLGGMVFVQVCLGILGSGLSESTFDQICRTCRDHKVQQVFVERTQTGGLYLSNLKARMSDFFVARGGMDETGKAYPEGWSCSVADHSPGGRQKEVRIIQTMQAMFQDHRLVVDPEIMRPPRYGPVPNTMHYQMAHITSERKCLSEYGALDSLAGAVQCAHNTIGVSTASSMDAVSEAEAAMREAMEFKRRYSLVGMKPPAANPAPSLKSVELATT